MFCYHEVGVYLQHVGRNGRDAADLQVPTHQYLVVGCVVGLKPGGRTRGQENTKDRLFFPVGGRSEKKKKDEKFME